MLAELLLAGVRVGPAESQVCPDHYHFTIYNLIIILSYHTWEWHNDDDDYDDQQNYDEVLKAKCCPWKTRLYLAKSFYDVFCQFDHDNHGYRDNDDYDGVHD